MFSNVSSIDLKFVLTLYSRSQIISPFGRLDDGNEENGTTRGFASGLSRIQVPILAEEGNWD